MTSISALENIHTKGLYGNYENKNEEDLLKVSEIKNLLIVQIVQYKNSSITMEEISIDSLILKNEPLNVISNNDTRILWNGPDKNNSINSTYNGITFTVDMINNSPDKVIIFALRSFGESLYHSITDASLEFGYKAL